MNDKSSKPESGWTYLLVGVVVAAFGAALGLLGPGDTNELVGILVGGLVAFGSILTVIGSVAVGVITALRQDRAER